jgi:hypothetical protein
MRPAILRALAAATSLVLVSGCGGGGGGGGSSTQATTLSGTAGFGAPAIDAAVNVQCATGAALGTTTDADGLWSVSMTSQTFPCLVVVTGGSVPSGLPLYSMAVDASHLNVNPLTSMVLAAGFQMPPASVVPPSLADANRALLQGELAVSLSLQAAGYTAAIESLTTGAWATHQGDPYDDMLEWLNRSARDAGVTVASIVASAGTAATGSDIPLPYTHVFTSAELGGMPQLNQASLSVQAGAIGMRLQPVASPVGAFVGGGTGSKAVLQLPGLSGTRLKDFKSMSMAVEGNPFAAQTRNIYPYVNFLVDLQCDGTPLAANATLADVRARRRMVIYDPFVQYVQTASAPLNGTSFTTVTFDFSTPGWRISSGAAVGTVAVNPNYVGNETFEGFDFQTYPNACIVDAVSGDAGMFRDASADPACNTTSALPATAPATCGKSHAGAMILVGDSATDVPANWLVKSIRIETQSVRTFTLQ